MVRTAFAALLLLFALSPAWADAVTVAATSGQMVAAATSPVQYISICNQSASASISACFADTTGSCTAILNTAGQYQIGPLQCGVWRPESRPPNGAIYGIASAGSTPVTVDRR